MRHSNRSHASRAGLVTLLAGAWLSALPGAAEIAPVSPTSTAAAQPRDSNARDSVQAPSKARPAALPAVDPIPAPPADRILRRQSEAILDDPSALLRAAETAISQQDEAHADWLYAQLAERHPIVGDHARLRRARLQLSKARITEARIIAEAALREFPDSPVRSKLHRVIGDALLAERNEIGARAAYAAALSETKDDDRRALLLRLVARSEERSGEDRAAGITWRLLWYAHPTSKEAKQASHRLDLIEAHLGERLRRASDWRRRGDRLFRKRQNQQALDAFDRALALGLSRSEARRTRKQRAQTLFRLRRYPEALRGFKSLPQAGDTPIWQARAMARADRVPESIAAFEKIAKKAGEHGPQARYLAALLLDGRDRDSEARAHFKILAEDPDPDGLGRAALWRLGWGDYRRGKHTSAIERFEYLAKATDDPLDRLRPLYWKARALEGLDPEAARSLFESLAENYPLSYYGWRARERIDTRDFARSEHTIRQGRTGLRPAELARVRILMEAGLEEASAVECGALMRRALGLDDRVSLARLLTSAGDYNRAQRIVVDAYSASLARGPVAGFEELWWYAWPSAYSELVDEATEEPESVDPKLVYSIMREESGYRPRVVSPVGARGLLQIMQETGAQLASKRGRKSFDPDDLFDPRINIEFGSFYLGELSRRFPTRLSASIASYNAGPQVVVDWVDQNERPDDEWVESIPYSQTRNYVKRVLRSLQAYRLLY
ncbi:MAG: transglycosylase SLT domain-containing protein [Myxococcota bacterium]